MENEKIAEIMKLIISDYSQKNNCSQFKAERDFYNLYNEFISGKKFFKELYSCKKIIANIINKFNIYKKAPCQISLEQKNLVEKFLLKYLDNNEQLLSKIQEISIQ